jgi:molecular chaperone DnaJ
MSNFEDVLRRSGFPGFSGPVERPRPGGRKGQNIVHTLLVSPLDIILGETVEARFSRAVPCPVCNGKGADLERCPTCGGTGSISQATQQEHFQQIVTFPCPKCQSHGWVKNNPCGHCNGEGLIQEEQREEVSLTGLSGDIQGATKIVYGVGHYGPFGGSPGDLLIQIIPLFPSTDKLSDEVVSLLKSAHSLMK